MSMKNHVNRESRHEFELRRIRGVQMVLDGATLTEAAEEGALIFFGDESGYGMNITNGKTWGLKGQTTVVYANDQKKKISVSGVISTEGDFFYEIYEGAMTAERYELFLSHLMETTDRVIYVIHDGLPSHRAQRIKDFEKR